jgi:hypothetical protein
MRVIRACGLRDRSRRLRLRWNALASFTLCGGFFRFDSIIESNQESSFARIPCRNRDRALPVG